MAWTIQYLPEANHDLAKLDGSTRRHVVKAIGKIASNPLPEQEGGYGKPLGRKRDVDLTGLLKIKLKKDGIRIVYKLCRNNDSLLVIIIGVRTEDEVYRQAFLRRKRRHL
jgi:mRNA interferase RelE/StbE